MLDTDALRRQKLEQLRVCKWSALRKSEQSATRPEQVTVAPEERSRLLKELYQKTFRDTAAPPIASGPSDKLKAARQTGKIEDSASVTRAVQKPSFDTCQMKVAS